MLILIRSIGCAAIHLMIISVMVYRITADFVVGIRGAVVPIPTPSHAFNGWTHIASVCGTEPFPALSATAGTAAATHTVVVSIVSALRNAVSVLIIPIVLTTAFTTKDNRLKSI